MNRAAKYGLCGLLVLLVGCASHRYVVVEPLATPLRAYSVLEIRNFSSNVSGDEAKSVADGMPALIIEQIAQRNDKAPDGKLFSSVTRSTDQQEGVLLVDGVLVSYEKGSRAKRYFIGFGAGKAFSTVQCTFTDKASGEQVSKAMFDGELSLGVFGGEAARAPEGVVKAIVDYLAENY